MDRQSLLAFLLIGLIIVFYPWYMSIVAPPSLEDQKDLTEQSQYLNEPTNNKVVTPQVSVSYTHLTLPTKQMV